MPFAAAPNGGAASAGSSVVPTAASSPSGGGNSNPGSSYSPYNTPIPNPQDYAQAAVLANNAYNNALAQINQSRLSTLAGYGYTGQIDPTTGTVTGVQVDPNAVYGELQNLLHAEGASDMAAANANHDRGVYGGLANQAVTESRYAYGGQKTAMGEALTGALNDLQNQQLSAEGVKNNALSDAMQTALQNELNAEAGMNPADFLSYMLSQVNKAPSTPTPPPAPAPKAPTAKARAVRTNLNRRHQGRQ